MSASYDCWLGFNPISDIATRDRYIRAFQAIVATEKGEVLSTAASELARALSGLLGKKLGVVARPASAKASGAGYALIGTIGGSKLVESLVSPEERASLRDDGYICKYLKDGEREVVLVAGTTERGALYGVFRLLRELKLGKSVESLRVLENPSSPIRMVNHWENADGSVERGYAGKAIFWEGGKITTDLDRVRDYARLLASVGLNGITISNVNVKAIETQLLSEAGLKTVKVVADLLRRYGVKVYMSINYASPIIIGGLKTADPLDPGVAAWWKEKAKSIYKFIPDFGGFIVKADSEFQPGPFFYKRNHSEGANVLADALEPYGGIVIWRCFVYNCVQDWRDYKTDRARAAFDNFKPLDGTFRPNVVLQIKNGPMDFQVREPVHPLFGGLEKTNQLMEFQITQEYTGQQIHLCYLASMWREILDFDTQAKGPGTQVKDIVTGKVFGNRYSGFAAVSNLGRDENWTGHDLAQANFYAYGRLTWNPGLGAREIAEDWVAQTFSTDPKVVKTICDILMDSWSIYESYNAPLGIGWMVNQSHHYGPSPDGYEYTKWGTYIRADHLGMGVDRSVAKGTGYAGLYKESVAKIYENKESCPEELLLFFHRVNYMDKLKSGKTLIQHIYDSHFEGVERVEGLIAKWQGLKGLIDEARHEAVLKKFNAQLENAKEWRDVVNAFFHRTSMIEDEKGRRLY